MTSFLEAQAQTAARGNPPREYSTGWIRVTVAQMLALDASPVVVVPAPGPGKVVVPLTLLGRGEGGTPYNQGNGNFALRFASGVEAIQLLDSLAGADAPFSYMGPALNGFVRPMENEAVVLATDVPGSGELTEGDYDVEFRLEYQIVEL